MCDTPTDWVQHVTMRPITILIMQKSLQMYKRLWITVWKEKKRNSNCYHILLITQNRREWKIVQNNDYDKQVYSLDHNKKI